MIKQREKRNQTLTLSPDREKDLRKQLASISAPVTADELTNRIFCGIECNPEYCSWALERLVRAETDSRIQGYEDGVFWERNSVKTGKKRANAPSTVK